MLFLYLALSVLSLALLALLTAHICYRMVFYSKKRVPLGEDEYDVPTGKGYDEKREELISWVKKKRALHHRDISVASFDGLTLRGKYYEYRPGAPIEILFHGYRGNAERDLSGAIERCFLIGRNALIVDQRAAGSSDGKVISFGINECRDCPVWVDKVIELFGSDVEIILAGISMGAATVTMASAKPLPSNVKYVIADCGYTSPEKIIRKVCREMHLPDKILYPFIKLGARIFGGFDLEADSSEIAVKSGRLPIIFFHGEADDFVPPEMSRSLFELCTAPKKLVTVKNAVHGLAFPEDKELYIGALKEFEKENSIFNNVNK